MKRYILFFLLAALFQLVQVRAQELVLYFPFEGTGDKVDDQSGKTRSSFENERKMTQTSTEAVFLSSKSTKIACLI